MTSLKPISIDRDWTCACFNGDPKPAALAASGQPVESLAAWTCPAPQGARHMVWLQRQFDLEPIDVCVQYTLHVEAAPGTVTLTINDRCLGEFDGRAPFQLDVTDAIWLEDNTIILQVRCADAAHSHFGAIFLQPAPCADQPH
jgi:hypothetical protein